MTPRSVCREWWYRLRDLVVPDECATCGAKPPLAAPLCAPCAATVDGLTVFRRSGVLPQPIWAAGDYSGVLREMILAFKVGGRRDLAPAFGRVLALPLANARAGAARSLATPRRPATTSVTLDPVILLPIPSTRRAARERGFDHVRSLANALSRVAVNCDWYAPLSAGPRPDSAGLSITARYRAATESIRPMWSRLRRLRRLQRERPQVRLFLLDDIVTSGATLCAANAMFRRAGIRVTGAIVIASVNRRSI